MTEGRNADFSIPENGDNALLRLICLFVSLLSLTAVRAAAEEIPMDASEQRVARAQFTTAIVDREPVDDITVVSPPIDSVFFFTDLRHMEGRTIIHRWEHAGRVQAQKPFKVEGPRWRVYSQVVLEPEQHGDWSVTVLDESGWPLYVEIFRYARENAARR